MQTYCVRYKMVTNSLDGCLLFILLPQFGLKGCFASFLITHLLIFLLSLRRLVIVSGIKVNLLSPVLSAAAAIVSVLGAMSFTGWLRQSIAFFGLFLSVCYLLGVIHPGDIQWLHSLFFPSKNAAS